MKLAQSSAIRGNQRYRIVLSGTTQYYFQQFSPTNGFVDVDSSENRLAQLYNLEENNLFFASRSQCNPLPADCFSPEFNADGTLSPQGNMGISDGNETQTLQWTIGGAIRIQ